MNWLEKAPSEVVERRWKVPLPDDDSISAVVAVATGVTVNSDDYEGAEAVVVLSAGTAGTEATVTVTVTTVDGLTLVETFYIAIRASTAALGYTAQDLCGFALEKIAGIGVTPDASESATALKRLNDMLALWRIDGLDVGVAAVLVLSDTVDIPDEYVAAIKWNLRLLCHEHFGVPLGDFDMMMAERAKTLVANRLLSLGDLTFDRTITRQNTVNGVVYD